MAKQVKCFHPSSVLKLKLVICTIVCHLVPAWQFDMHLVFAEIIKNLLPTLFLICSVCSGEIVAAKYAFYNYFFSYMGNHILPSGFCFLLFILLLD